MTTITTTKSGSENGRNELGESSEEMSESSESSEEMSESTRVREELRGRIVLHLSSFGYECVGRGGVDRATTVIKDLRQLSSPQKSMMANGLTGEDKRLRDDLFSHAEVEEAYQEAKSEIIEAMRKSLKDQGLVPAERQAGKDQDDSEGVRFAFGCHRGKHRSVSFVERLKIELASKDVIVTVCHFALRPNQFSKDYKKKSFEKRKMIFHDED